MISFGFIVFILHKQNCQNIQKRNKPEKNQQTKVPIKNDKCETATIKYKLHIFLNLVLCLRNQVISSFLSLVNLSLSFFLCGFQIRTVWRHTKDKHKCRNHLLVLVHFISFYSSECTTSSCILYKFTCHSSSHSTQCTGWMQCLWI